MTFLYLESVKCTFFAYNYKGGRLNFQRISASYYTEGVLELKDTMEKLTQDEFKKLDELLNRYFHWEFKTYREIYNSIYEDTAFENLEETSFRNLTVSYGNNQCVFEEMRDYLADDIIDVFVTKKENPPYSKVQENERDD